MTTVLPGYVVITPARDESSYIQQTIKCMRNQTTLPLEWIIVNDGSSDATGEIVDRAATSVAWIHAVHRPDRGFRAAGSGVMDAFYAGYKEIKSLDWQFIVKLDGDLTFDESYFEKCFGEFLRDENLGIGGGVILNRTAAGLEIERHPRFHVRGATKIYRRKCWEDIQGLIPDVGWDTVDEIKANMAGWDTRSFSDTTLVQERFTGDAAGQWSNWVKNGRASFKIGYHPVYVIVKSMARAVKRPYLKATSGLLWGFFSSYARSVPRVVDRKTSTYLRKHQLRRLLGLSSIWK